MKLIAVVSLALVCALASSASAEDAGSSLDPYAFVRFDVIFDDSTMDHPQFPGFVADEDVVEADDPELSMHPRLTRFGVKLAPRSLSDGVEASGVIEVDFQNGGKESREALRMRHAFLAIDSGIAQILAGQTWDLVSPLYPSANGDSMMWNAGNPGDRRPQLRVTLSPPVGGGTLRLAVAAGMPNAVNNQDLDGNGQLDGLDAATPTVQGLAEVTLRRMQISTWAHYARDRVTVMSDAKTYTGLLVGGHAKVTVGQLWFQGEAFWGQNATDVRAGIGQGINLADETEIATVGGWAEVGFKASDEYTVAAGATVDRPDAADLPEVAAGAPEPKQRNMAVYLVQFVQPWQHTKLGVEYLHWRTKYRSHGISEANRVNVHLTLSF